MSTRVIVKRNEYYDSVRLMQTAEKLRRIEGVKEAMLMMGTDNNKRLLEVAGLLAPEVVGASANDMIIAIVADRDTTADAAQQQAEQLLKERITGSAGFTYRTLDSALAAMPDSNLTLISIPGQYAASEARRALQQRLNVMLFSDNVTLEDEVSLKQLAHENGLLLMGPDCGTAIINGIGLGFANAVRRGPIGVVGASGTGIQELSSLIDRQGIGVSHAIGTGGRDLSAAVGGITMLDAIDLLAADVATEAIVLTSKPPDPDVSKAILKRVAQSPKPVVVNFLGGDSAAIIAAGAIPAATLEEAAHSAIRLITKEQSDLRSPEAEIKQQAALEAEKLSAGQKFIRGVFSGGTLCYEAMLILSSQVGPIFSNIPIRPELRLRDPWHSYHHTLIDLGEDEFTQGRAHPMIDSTLRIQRLLAEAQDPETAILLLDIVLGYGAQEDPAGSLAASIRQARAVATEEGRYLVVIASICGTDNDVQDLVQQKKALQAVGAVVMASNAQASLLANRIIQLAGS